MGEEQVRNKSIGQGPFYEVVDAAELAKRWKIPVSWVREQVRSRATDPIPHAKLGRYRRFCWGSPALDAWWNRRLAGIKRAS